MPIRPNFRCGKSTSSAMLLPASPMSTALKSAGPSGPIPREDSRSIPREHAMASIVRQTSIDAPADEVWLAVRDFGAVDKRLVPGFVIESRMYDDRTRVVTFFNGGVAREALVGVDDDARRLAYTVTEGPLGAAHHNSSAQVFGVGEGGSRLVWITDV